MFCTNYIGIVITSSNCVPGVRIKRGMDWQWGDQDIVESSTMFGIQRKQVLGTVVEVRDDDWAKVMWDNGYSNIYRIGGEKSFDLYKIELGKNQSILTFFNIAFDHKILKVNLKLQILSFKNNFSWFFRITRRNSKRTGRSKTTYRSKGYRRSVLHQPTRNR